VALLLHFIGIIKSEEGILMIENADSSAERRGSPRIDLEVQVLINPSHQEFRIPAWIQDISNNGFRVKADMPLNIKGLFRQGSEVFFETLEDFFQLKGRGDIVWASPEGDTAGIKFDDLGEKGRQFLDEFLRMFNQNSTPAVSFQFNIEQSQAKSNLR
jgi:hypothetical protein